MHSAPWAKTSTSAPQERQMMSVSRAESSLASTTRSMPSSAASFAPDRVCRLIWVLA